jgi:hypothetical protein
LREWEYGTLGGSFQVPGRGRVLPGDREIGHSKFRD